MKTAIEADVVTAAEVLRLREQIALYTKQRDEAEADRARLRGLIKKVEWERQGDPHWTACPWGCTVKTNWDTDEDRHGRPSGAHGYQHDSACPAFWPDGTVR